MFLVKTHPKVIDNLNLSTNDNLTYANVKKWLLDISGLLGSNLQTALTTTPRERKGKSKGKVNFSSDPKPKTGIWCARHKTGKENGHRWNECFSLEKFNERQKAKSEDNGEKGKGGQMSPTRQQPLGHNRYGANHSILIPRVPHIQHHSQGKSSIARFVPEL